jgi:hypothetical protein
MRNLMTDSHTNEPPLANVPPANSMEPAPSGGKGCLGCLVIIVLLIVLGIMFRPSWIRPWASSLNPAQRTELGRLIGKFEGFSYPQDIFSTGRRNNWTARFYTDEANRLKCECALIYIQRDEGGREAFREIVNVQYQDSEKPGYIKIASSDDNEQWKIYVESPVLKSGKEITSIMVCYENFEQCILHRQ